MRVFVIHAKKLGARKGHLAPLLAAEGADVEWVERLDPDDIDESTWVRRVYGSLSEQEVSCFLKHEFALTRIVQLEHGLILEDDALPQPGFVQRLERLLDELPPTFDVLYVGASAHVPTLRPDAAPLVKVERGPTLVGYFVSQRGARRITTALAEGRILRPIDLSLDQLIGELPLEAYRLAEPLAAHGSENGLFESSLGVAWREKTLRGRVKSAMAKRVRRAKTEWARWLAG